MKFSTSFNSILTMDLCFNEMIDTFPVRFPFHRFDALRFDVWCLVFWQMLAPVFAQQYNNDIVKYVMFAISDQLNWTIEFRKTIHNCPRWELKTKNIF